MELYRKRGHILVVYALAGVVVAVYKAYLGVIGQILGNYRVAVVLRSDVDPVCLDVSYGLVSSAVAVFELCGLASLRESHKLVAEADAEHRPSGFIERISSAVV